MKASAIAVCLLFVSAAIMLARGQLSGIVTSSKSKVPEKEVEVFINNTSIHALTDEAGKFSLREIPEGYWEIVLYKDGFDLYRSIVKIQRGKSYGLNLSIQPSEKRKSVAADANFLSDKMLSGGKST